MAADKDANNAFLLVAPTKWIVSAIDFGRICAIEVFGVDHCSSGDYIIFEQFEL